MKNWKKSNELKRPQKLNFHKLKKKKTLIKQVYKYFMSQTLLPLSLFEALYNILLSSDTKARVIITISNWTYSKTGMKQILFFFLGNSMYKAIRKWL